MEFRVRALIVAASFALAAEGQTRKPAMTRVVQPAAPELPTGIEPMDWRFAHPDAAFLLSVRVGSLMSSPFVLALPDELARAGVPGVSQQQVNRLWDLLNGIESVAISIVQRPGNKQADGLILLTGRFEEGMLVPLLRQSGGASQSISLNPTTLLLGEGPDLEAAARRITAGGPMSDLVRSANQLAPEHDLWIGGDLAPLVAGAAPAAPEVRQLLADIVSVSLGMSFQEKADMQLTVGTAGPAATKRLLSRMHSLNAAKDAQVEQAGNELRVRVTGEPKRFSADLASFASSMRTRAEPQPAPVREEPKPTRNTIIIHGLKDGPREIAVK